jgi:hypothetical protein
MKTMRFHTLKLNFPRLKTSHPKFIPSQKNGRVVKSTELSSFGVTQEKRYFPFSVPGKGIACGGKECSRYADCQVNIDGSKEIRLSKCFCLPGFKGNGQTCTRLKAHEGD